jgi:hypothetical protein
MLVEIAMQLEIVLHRTLSAHWCMKDEPAIDGVLAHGPILTKGKQDARSQTSAVCHVSSSRQLLEYFAVQVQSFPGKKQGVVTMEEILRSRNWDARSYSALSLNSQRCEVIIQ